MSESVNKVYVDADKLGYELRVRGLSWSQASVKIGYGNSALGNAKSRGYIPKPTAILLENILNIPEESYSKSAESKSETNREISANNNDTLQEILNVLNNIYELLK